MKEANPSLCSKPDSVASFAVWLQTKRKGIFVFASLAAVFWSIFYFQFTVDDAFILFRYGKNLVAHHLWNWNPSGIHEEAYTSATYAVLSIVPALFHISPSLFFKFVGLACIGAMLYRLRTAAASQFGFLLGVLTIACNPWFWIHAYAGLETPLYILLLLEMAICVHRAASTSAWRVYALFLLLPLTRPEGIIFACVGVALFWWRRERGRQFWLFAIALLLGVIYFVARWDYFHHLLPNPYYLKLAHADWNRTRTVLLNNLNESKGYFLVLLMIGLLARQIYTRVFALCGFLLLLLLYAPHDMQMNYADRFYFQVACPFLLFFFIAEDLIPMARIAFVLAAIFLCSITVPYLMTAINYFPFRTQADIDLAQRLAPFAQNHTILTPNAGAIPYYSDWVAYDFFGLGTYRIGPDKLTPSLLEELHPDLILVESTEPDLKDFWALGTYPNKYVEIEFLRQSSEYEYVGESGCRGIYNVEFLRKDTLQHDEIVRALQQNMRSSAKSDLTWKDILLQRYVRWKD
jgi:arabinofuranosyltransferase